MTAIVTFEHPDYVAKVTMWRMIRDILAGEEWLKNRCREQGGANIESYLPLPDVESTPAANLQRFRAYVQRATLYNATERTLFGMVGQIFSKPATTEFPDSLKYLKDDPAGTGVTLEQHAKKTLSEVLALGRRGLWIDAPSLSTPLSVAEAESGEFRPVIIGYNAEDIINWRTQRINAKTYLTLVVLKEQYPIIDEFAMQWGTAYRELRLVEGVYMMRRWAMETGKSVLSPEPWVIPTDARGEPFTEIPFVFVGIRDNDVDVDSPPLYSLSSLNIAHFRNSADYEENVYMLGQATAWFSGVTEAWVKDVWKGTIYLGARGGVPLPQNGQCGLLQVSENGLVKEAMDQKESQMISLGAQLATSPDVQKTATEIRQDKVSEVSTLAAAARNTSAAYMRAFEFCAKFSGDAAEIKFELSTDYDMARMTSQEILALVATWQAKLMTTRETRNVLRRAGYATEELEKAISEGVAKEAPDEAEAGLRTDNRVKKQEDPSGVN